MGQADNASHRTLTLSEVKHAGVVAWRDDQTLFADGRLLRVHVRAENLMQLTLSVLADDEERHYGDGWHHLADCGCPFCATD